MDTPKVILEVWIDSLVHVHYSAFGLRKGLEPIYPDYVNFFRDELRLALPTLKGLVVVAWIKDS